MNDYKLNIDKAIELFNSRLEKNGKKMNQTKLGMLIQDNERESKSIAVTLCLLVKGKTKSVRTPWIARISKALGVDPNFICGTPSKFDKEYKLLETTRNHYK